MSASEITRELCDELDIIIEFAKQARAPIRAISLIERARADLQAIVDRFEQSSNAIGGPQRLHPGDAAGHL